MERAAYEAKLQWAVRLSQQATSRDREGRIEEAFELYKLALDQWNILRKGAQETLYFFMYTRSVHVKKRGFCEFCVGQSNALLRGKLHRKMHEYITRAETLRVVIARQQKQQFSAKKHSFYQHHPATDWESGNPGLATSAASAGGIEASAPAIGIPAAPPSQGVARSGCQHALNRQCQPSRHSAHQLVPPPQLLQQHRYLFPTDIRDSSTVSGPQSQRSGSAAPPCGSGAADAVPGCSGSLRAATDPECTEEERMKEKLTCKKKKI